MGSLTPGFSSVQPQLLHSFGQWTNGQKNLYFFFLCPFFISVYLSNKCLLKDKNLKIIVKIKGPAAEVPRRGEEAWRMGVSRVLTVVQPPFWIKSPKDVSSWWKPANWGLAQETTCLKQLNKEKKGKKEIFHKARPELMLSALYLHIHT